MQHYKKPWICFSPCDKCVNCCSFHSIYAQNWVARPTACNTRKKLCVCFCIGLSRYIAITNLSITAVFLEYLRQFLIDLNQTYRHSKIKVAQFFDSRLPATYPTVVGCMLAKNYASVSQSRDSLDRDRHNVTKKARRRRALKPLDLRSWKNSGRRVFGTRL